MVCSLHSKQSRQLFLPTGAAQADEKKKKKEPPKEATGSLPRQ